MADTNRFLYIDYMRGLVVALMGLDHASYYFNSIWLWFEPLDPLFDSIPQFLTRYSSYLCAPGFLMLAGAMVYNSFRRRTARGTSARKAQWDTIQRGLFLVLLQLTWVNSSWSGFARLRLAHIGIIASIGISIALLALIIRWRWPFRLALALVLFAVHPWLLQIPYDASGGWQALVMEAFVTAGDFNKYPVIPWFALCTFGSVIAVGWFQAWPTNRIRIRNSLLVALVAALAGLAVRMGHGYGNLFAYSQLGSVSFFLFQKYPPSLVHQCWTVAAIVFLSAVFMAVGDRARRVLKPLEIYGSVALFFYLMHIPILALVAKRGGLMYRAGGLGATYLGWIALLAVMVPLCYAFARIKARSRNPLLRMI